MRTRAIALLIGVGATLFALSSQVLSDPVDAQSPWIADHGGFDFLADVAALAPDDVWAVGSNLVHYDGKRWIADSRETSPRFSGIDIVGGGHGIAVSQFGAMELVDGQWRALQTPNDLLLFDVSMLADGMTWALGRSDATGRHEVWRWAGVSWSRQFEASEGEKLNGIWMRTAADGWVVGDSGVVLHYDGAAWSRVSVPSKLSLETVSGTASDDVWVGGGAGPSRGPGWWRQLLHFDGNEWRVALHEETGGRIVGIDFDGTHGYAVDATGGLLEYVDGAWLALEDKISASRLFQVSSLSMVPSSESAVVSTYNGRILLVSHGGITQLNEVGTLDSIAFHDVNTGWTVGERARFEYRDGTWMTIPATSALSQTLAVGGDPNLGVWAVGHSGRAQLYRGGEWRPVATGTNVNLNIVRVVSPSTVWMSGFEEIPDESPLRYRSSVVVCADLACRPVWERTGDPLNAVVRDINGLTSDVGWAVTGDGQIHEYDHGVWRQVPSVPRVKAVAMLSETTGWLAAEDSIYRREGNTTEPVFRFPRWTQINRLVFDSIQSGWTVALRGWVASYDGDAWAVVRGPGREDQGVAVPAELNDIATVDWDGGTRVWVVGSSATILYASAEDLVAARRTPLTPIAAPTTKATATPTPTATPDHGTRSSVYLPLLHRY